MCSEQHGSMDCLRVHQIPPHCTPSPARDVPLMCEKKKVACKASMVHEEWPASRRIERLYRSTASIETLKKDIVREIRLAVSRAKEHKLAHGAFFGTGRFDPLHAHLSDFLHDFAEWQSFSDTNQAYSTDKFLYSPGQGARNNALFADCFSKGVLPIPGLSWSDVKALLCAATDVSPMTTMYPFVLSKTDENMTWHVDGGPRAGTDLVVYFVFGPEDAESVFYTFSPEPRTQTETKVTRELRMLDRDRIPIAVSTLPTDGEDTPRAIDRVQYAPFALESQTSYRAYRFRAKPGDIVAFDGSTLHGVVNKRSPSTLLPQVALAINVRDGVPQIMRNMAVRPVRVRMGDVDAGEAAER